MIALRILGPSELTAVHGGELRSVLAQPKRLAVLVYLLLSAPGGFCRRDTLLALFWPELDTARARDALKQTIRFLRRELEDHRSDIVVSRGGELGIARHAIWCDALAFSDAVAQRRFAEALALYRGDLLEGFFPDASPAFTEWLERERAQRRAAASAAADALAAMHVQSDQPERAVAYARRAVELSGSDERLLRRLLELLDRLGDRAGAIETYDRFVEHLEKQLEVRPSPETIALVEGIRARVAVRTTAPAIDHAADVTVLVPSVRNRRPRYWRAAVPALAIAALAIITWRALAPPSSISAPGSDPFRVAVMPFAVRGNPELTYLGDGMVDLLSVNLDGAGDLRAVGARALLSQIGRRGGPATVQDPAGARAIARDLSADAFVLGTVIGLPDRVRIVAWLYPLRADDPDTIHAVVEGPAIETGRLVDELATQLLVGRTRGETAYFTRLAALTTDSFAALKSYVEGEARWRARQNDSAIVAFRRAVEIDSTFALAYYRLAVAAEWSMLGQSQDALAKALAHAGRLPGRHRMLLDAFSTRHAGALARAESMYVRIVRAYPDDPEAWFQLATLRTPQSLPWGQSTSGSREAFERTLALDPDHPRAAGGLAWIAGHEGNHDEAVSHLQTLARHDQGELADVIRAAIAFRRGDAASQRAAIARLRQTPDPRRILFAADFVAQRAGNAAGGVLAASVLTDPSRPPRWRAFGFIRIADLEQSRGRRRAAREALRAASELAPTFALHAAVNSALSPFSGATARDLAELRSRMVQWVAPTPRDSIRREHLLGHLGARASDLDAAQLHAARLDSLSRALSLVDSMRLGAMARDLALAVRAHVEMRRGRNDTALALLERWRPDEWWTPMPTVTKPDPDDPGSLLTGHMYSFERWLRAELLVDAGRAQEAVPWYEGLGFIVGEDLSYLPPSRLRLAALYERRGDVPKARAEYLRFLDLWRDCDPDARDMLADAQRKAARLAVAGR